MTCREYLPFNSFPCLCLIWFGTNFEDTCHSDATYLEQTNSEPPEIYFLSTSHLPGILGIYQKILNSFVISRFTYIGFIRRTHTVYQTANSKRESKQEIIKKNWFVESKFFVFPQYTVSKCRKTRNSLSPKR